MLRMDGLRESWLSWFALAGLDLPDPAGGLVTEDSSLILRTAADGAGVVLMRHAIASQEIAAGELLRLFDIAIKNDLIYYFVTPADAVVKPQVQYFHDWITQEIDLFKAYKRWLA